MVIELQEKTIQYSHQSRLQTGELYELLRKPMNIHHVLQTCTMITGGGGIPPLPTHAQTVDTRPRAYLFSSIGLGTRLIHTYIQTFPATWDAHHHQCGARSGSPNSPWAGSFGLRASFECVACACQRKYETNTCNHIIYGMMLFLLRENKSRQNSTEWQLTLELKRSSAGGSMKLSFRTWRC